MSLSKTLGDCRLIHTKGELTLSSGITVAELKLRDTYGLSVSVLRKSDGRWIETMENGRLRLEGQNKQ